MPDPNASPLTPPKILVQAPKRFLQTLDLSRMLHEALRATNYQEPLTLIIALGVLDSYLDAAKREQRRISRAQLSIRKYQKLRQSSLFHDVHFYLISWARIAKLARFIRDQTRFRRTGLVIRQYNSELDKRIDGRDHLEHFEERLPGGPKQGKLKVPNDLLNMTNNSLNYGGYKIDVGPSSINILQKFVEEFRTALLFDSIETIETTNPDRLIELFQHVATRMQIEKLTKMATKQLRAKE